MIQRTDPNYLSIRGHYHEILFRAEMLRRGFTVLTCEGSHGPMDVVVYKNGKFLGVQIKGTEMLRRRHRTNKGWDNSCYSVANHSRSSRKKYHQQGVHVMAVYIDPLKLWYLIPTSSALGMRIRINPNSTRGVNSFRERWDVFDQRTQGTRGEDELVG
jgi:hypothetical protein